MYPRKGTMDSRALREIKPRDPRDPREPYNRYNTSNTSNTSNTNSSESPLVFPDAFSLTTNEIKEIDYLLHKHDVQIKLDMVRNAPKKV
jgi:hypothetical protein